ncbi:universal stress protein UspA-like nucleotide-binding protein [Paramagnetospirillum caucaseum]|uniref:Universal stress protein UspA-like nucleotide-binding protein n=1 Tax=Paramagnetospirillum caucaseum TaxID=1244869 RepID=M3A985_9PROT|nr:universal stress protein [Paramagnetospirillum caucaseum]EME69348.1 universal stress protein UspA-like nucleotide-binding protein [Paramagnetospirillum caucaseum]
MTYKDILVHVDDDPRARVRLDLAAGLAARFQAHLIALNVRDQVPLPSHLTAQFGGDLDQIRAAGDAEAARRVKTLADGFDAGPGVTREWRDVSGPIAEVVALHARYADLAVIGQAEPDSDSRRLADELILAVGRPVLVVPFAGRFPTPGRRVMVAWNGGREATRAVHDAMPLLVGAQTVHVIAINPGHGMAGHGDIPGADICLHLSRHGVNAVCEHVASDDLNVGEMLLSRAADEDVDLMVMGGYGRSRLREMVLGGATRHMLESMTVPVLFSH